MGEYGTAFPSWYITFQQAVLAALPRPPQLEKDIGLGWADNGGALTKVLAEVLLPQAEEIDSTVAPVPAYPADGEIFELTLDGEAPENDPLEMVRRDGYNTEGWRHTDKKVRGKQTGRFKLVRVGRCRNLNEVCQRLGEQGAIPEGQWREAFRVAYPQRDGKGPVGLADSSWVAPDGAACFPYVRTDGSSSFHWTAHDFSESWRWLVAVGK